MAALLFLTQTGCVQRRLTIRSNPPGALVYVDNEEIGMTPVATDFIYYGTRQIRLVKDGFETLTVLQPIPAPWYQVFPLDFFAENVVPGEIRDERVFDYAMQPAMIVPSQTLLDRAEELRRTQGAAPVATTPSPYAVPAPQPSPQYVRPPAVLNYPPSGPTTNPPSNFAPPPSPTYPQTHLPGDFGGTPVPPMP